MSVVSIDKPTGALVIGGRKAFPIVLSNAPPHGSKAPNGKPALAELAAHGVGLLRTGISGWSGEFADGQIANERARLDAAAAHGVRCWVWLGELANLPAAAGSPREKLLTKVVNGLKGHPGLGAWKGEDEPRNPLRGKDWIRPAGLVRGYKRVKALDPNHPLVIIQAPRSSAAELAPYRPAFDITGADIYPISYPQGIHAGGANKDISVVGDVTRKMVVAAGAKPVWMTLQIAWSGMTPSQERPGLVPRFPSLHEERFMAYQAIVNGARGLTFFGGHLTQVSSPADAKAGWNWSFWERVLRPLLAELTSTAVGPALVAPNAPKQVTAGAGDVELVTRRDGGFVYVIAARRGGATSIVTFSGLPAKTREGQVLFEYVQEPLPPPIGAGKQVFRPVAAADGRFKDWFGPHDVHVYRFKL